MKRTIKKSNDAEKREAYSKLLHELLADAEDYVERHELDSYINKDNSPKDEALEEDPNVSVIDVLMIGSILTLRKLHHELHAYDAQDIESALKQIGITSTVIKSVDLPDDVVDTLMKALNVDDNTKPKPKGKKKEDK